MRPRPPATDSRIAARVAATSPTRSTSGARLAVSAFGGGVEPDQLRLLAEAAAEAEPEVDRHADDERHVGPLQAGAAGAAEGQLVVGGEAAAAQPVEEDGDPERLGQRPQLLLAVAPVEAGAGHDRRPLGAVQQRRRLLDPGGRLRLGDRGGRDLGLGLAEDDVERVVDEGRPAGRAQRQVERRRGPRRDRRRSPSPSPPT